jgi:NTP pyrophosphatase (non-canonical NTP hydrolase)
MKDLVEEIRQFTQERDWDRYHSPKNLAMALAVEATEILEHFQWLSQSQSRALPPDIRDQVRDEIGDVFIYLSMLSDKLGIDPMEAAFQKLEKNRSNYPAERVRGKANKYSEYETR